MIRHELCCTIVPCDIENHEGFLQGFFLIFIFKWFFILLIFAVGLGGKSFGLFVCVCMYLKFMYVIWNNHLKEYFLLEGSQALLSFIFQSMGSSSLLMEWLNSLFYILKFNFFFLLLLPCRLMTVMSFPCNLTLIVRMENIYHLTLIGMSAIFTHFIGNVVVVASVFVADCMIFYLGCSSIDLSFHDFFRSSCFMIFYLVIVIWCMMPNFVWIFLEATLGIYVVIFLPIYLVLYNPCYMTSKTYRKKKKIN